MLSELAPVKRHEFFPRTPLHKLNTAKKPLANTWMERYLLSILPLLSLQEQLINKENMAHMEDLHAALIEDASVGTSSAMRSDGRSSTLVTFNLRGTMIVIPATVADDYQGSTLWKVLRDVQRPVPIRDSEGHLYFNRNPTLFHAVLDAMNSGIGIEHCASSDAATSRLPGLQEELRFWGIRSKRERSDDEPAQRDNPKHGLHAPTAAASGFRSYGALEVTYAKDSPFLRQVR